VRGRFIIIIFAVAAELSPIARLERFDARFLFPQNIIEERKCDENSINPINDSNSGHAKNYGIE
jgi:hypothetical protein